MSIRGLFKSEAAFAWTLLSVLAVIWGSSFILIKKGLISLQPDHVGSLRILAAAAVLTPIAIKRIPRVGKRHVWKLLSVGLAGSFIPAFLFAIAQTRIDSAIAGVLNAVTPLWVLIIGIVFFFQKLNVRVLLGLLLGFVGTAVLVLANQKGEFGLNLFGLYVVGATICYGVNLNLIKYKMADLDAVTITSIALAMVGPLALIHLLVMTDFVQVAQQGGHAYISIGAIVLLGVMSTAVALVMFNKLVQITNPIFTSSVTYLIPIVAILWGLLDGEVLNSTQIFGMLLILVGVFVTNQRK